MFSNSKPLEVIIMIVMAVLAFVTGEFVTFIMLGLILMQLHNLQRAIERSNETKHIQTSEEGTNV
ncbi:hypothetical protein [Geomicrobium sediminis]|uniref:Uncharacterized protein n=1 Tax=Geomicrobium sediminis TaxID=1347788 RepID=A0ABS2PHH1_9BACL|nr:hypothetical protein [Geomicrobium sediminis]MBM7634884.1 hypothetical protein [Geomicrobium sediminis]